MLDHLADDAIVVWKASCLARSLKDVLPIIEKIAMVVTGARSMPEHTDTAAMAERM
jgi:DNA invertase Pin-like site-specific DNA recombinase